jgi:hypothetical protein
MLDFDLVSPDCISQPRNATGTSLDITPVSVSTQHIIKGAHLITSRVPPRYRHTGSRTILAFDITGNSRPIPQIFGTPFVSHYGKDGRVSGDSATQVFRGVHVGL